VTRHRPAATPAAEMPSDVRWMRRGAAALVVLAVLVFLALGAVKFVRQPLFTIRGVTVLGETDRVTPAGVRAHLRPLLGDSFLVLDLAKVRGALEAMPWVRHATVRRVWPNRLVVTLAEHRPAALWGSERGIGESMVDTLGAVFDGSGGDIDDTDLPLLHGPDGSAARVLAMHGRLAAALAPIRRQPVELVLSNRGSWTVAFADGVELELGRGADDEVVARTARFASTLPELLARFQRPLVHADLRHADGYAVRLKGVATFQTPTPAKPGRAAAAAPR
jgi:cell division protein FtsQ